MGRSPHAARAWGVHLTHGYPAQAMRVTAAADRAGKLLLASRKAGLPCVNLFELESLIDYDVAARCRIMLHNAALRPQ